MSRIARLLGPCLTAALAGLIAVGQPTPSHPPKLTAEQQEKLKTRDRFVNDANKFESAGRLAEARAAVEKVLAVEREVLGDTHPDVAVSLGQLTVLCLRLDDLPAAREYGKKALAIRTVLHGEAHWKTADARHDLADVDIRAKLSKEQRTDSDKADRLARESLQHSDRGEYPKAGEAAEKVLALRKTILGEKHPKYADDLNNLASVAGQTPPRQAQAPTVGSRASRPSGRAVRPAPPRPPGPARQPVLPVRQQPPGRVRGRGGSPRQSSG